MKIGIGAKLTTGMTLTPQMQQAIRLLQLSSIELEQEVQQKLDSNPMLEREEPWESDDNYSAAEANDSEDTRPDNRHDNDDVYQLLYDTQGGDDTANNWQQTTYERSPDNPASTASDSEQDDWYAVDDSEVVDSSEYFASEHLDIQVDSHWEDVYTDEPTGLARLDTEQISDDNKLSTQGNIQDHIRWQLNLRRLSTLDMLLADYLIDSMDERGFITLNNAELYQSFATMLSFYQIDEVSLEPDDIELVVKQIQNCEPLGVGARNLTECLLIQLHKLPSTTPYLEPAKQILTQADLFINNNIQALLKSTNLAITDIQPALALLRTLNPNPANSYEISQRQFDFMPESYDIPDVLVTLKHHNQQQNWEVSLNPDTLPKLRINRMYANLVSRNDNTEQGLYLKEQLYDARLFIRSIEERNQNLLKVATCIVKRQQAFFEQGVMAMQPMILKDVAEEVELHESTVSRITTSKTMLTPKGLFSLKYFFSSQVSGEEGEGVSSTAINAMIKQMIETEDPKKPLSDNTIMARLKADGIDIARRTVTKYRESMNIGSSTQRKRKF